MSKERKGNRESKKPKSENQDNRRSAQPKDRGMAADFWLRQNEMTACPM